MTQYMPTLPELELLDVSLDCQSLKGPFLIVFSALPFTPSLEYQLFAFISHMGTSTMCGHYVCHIKKEGR